MRRSGGRGMGGGLESGEARNRARKEGKSKKGKECVIY